MSQILSLQRERINNLEREYDSLYEKYEYLMGSKPITTDSVIETLLNKEISGLKTKADLESYESTIKQHAKELSQMKAKMTEQGAQMLLQKDDRYFIKFTRAYFNLEVTCPSMRCLLCINQVL